MKVAYEFSRGSVLPQKKAAVVARYLINIQRRTGRELKPPEIVALARPPRSPLHPFFEWDDTVAAEKWRLWQARYLLSQIRVTFTNGASQGPVHLFINLTTEQDGENERGYIMVTDVLKDPRMRQQVLARALAEADAWRQKYQLLNELGEIFAAVDAVKIRQFADSVG